MIDECLIGLISRSRLFVIIVCRLIGLSHLSLIPYHNCRHRKCHVVAIPLVLGGGVVVLVCKGKR